MLWPFTKSAHGGHAFSGSNFFPLTEKASYILLLFSQWKPRAEQESFAPNWFASSGLVLVGSTPVLASVNGCWRGLLVNLHQLFLPKLVNVTLAGIFVKEFCCILGNHGTIWANFCFPSKTTKLVQISIGLPKRASKKCSYWKNQLSTWTLTNFKFKQKNRLPKLGRGYLSRVQNWKTSTNFSDYDMRWSKASLGLFSLKTQRRGMSQMNH